MFKSVLLLFKLRLSLTVVLSSVLGYLIAVFKMGAIFSWTQFIFLFLGGLLVTCAANTFNQILEKEQDGIMKRTQNRPLVLGALSITTAFFIGTILALIGFCMLYFGTTPFAAVVSLVSLILYAFVYTPSKKFTSFCVLIGAIPGALPPLIGYLAAGMPLDTVGWYLFIFQFLWQFPHFWAIAWSLYDDYQKVGYHMLPTSKGKTKNAVLIILVYTVLTVILGILPYFADLLPLVGMLIILAAGFYFIYTNIRLFKTLENSDAKQFMFASLIFMPTVLITLIF